MKQPATHHSGCPCVDERIAGLTATVQQVDDALGNGAREDIWPPGMTRGQAVARLTFERDRYRAALRTIARQSPGCGGYRDLALEALEEVTT